MSAAGRIREDAPATCCSSVTEVPLGDAEATSLARTYAALSDPVRLRLLSLIASAGEMCSCDLVEPLAKSQPAGETLSTRILAGPDRRRQRSGAAGSIGGSRPNGSTSSAQGTRRLSAACLESAFGPTGFVIRPVVPPGTSCLNRLTGAR